MMKYTGTFNGKEGMKVARDEETAQIFEKPLVTVTVQPPLERLRMFLETRKNRVLGSHGLCLDLHSLIPTGEC